MFKRDGSKEKCYQKTTTKKSRNIVQASKDDVRKAEAELQ